MSDLIDRLKANVPPRCQKCGCRDCQCPEVLFKRIADLEGQLQEAIDALAEKDKQLHEYAGWSPHQFTGLLAEHRKLQREHIALDSVRAEQERQIQQLQGQLRKFMEQSGC